jgi:hypothetical protein
VTFRWTALVALWTLLIGPVVNSAPKGMTRPPRTVVVIRYVAPAPTAPALPPSP